MKTTYYTTGFFADEAYSSGIYSFMQQYRDRFPGLCYLHLSLEQVVNGATATGKELQYYGAGKCLKISLAKMPDDRLPPPFEVYEELLALFDIAVEQHLENHQEEFLVNHFNQVAIATGSQTNTGDGV